MIHERFDLARVARPAYRLCVLAAALSALAIAQTTPNSFFVHKFVSDLSGFADHQDPNLVNPWGNGFGQSPFWVGNNGTGTSTLYDGTGAAKALVVDIPAAGGSKTGGPVTGVIFNTFSSNTSEFAVAAGKASSFIFCSTDGLITGWNSSVSSTEAEVLFDNSATGAVYTGCALGGVTGAPLLFATNFHAGTVDVFDGTLTPVHNTGAFVNAGVPAGYAPYNVAVINGNVYVAYAKQDSKQKVSVPGAGNGYLALFDQTGKLVANLIATGALNAPWGLAVAPSTFGPFGGALLVGNFGDGKINAYNLINGDWLATLNDPTGAPISYPGLWSLAFGSGSNSEDPGTLYFTAGIGGGPNNDAVESHGLLGSIQPVPSFPVTGIQNAGSFLASDIAPNTWVALKGSALAPLPASWTVTGSTLPTTVGGVGVTVNSEAAPVSFVSNTQINFLVPADVVPGTVKIQATSNGLSSAAVSTTALLTAPSFFQIGVNATNGHIYAAAEHANYSLIGPPGLISGVTTTGAAPGETIVLYGTGFGATTTPIPNGQIIPAPMPLPAWPTVVVDAIEAQVVFAGLVGPGLYQINVAVPAGLASGDHLITALLGDSETQLNTYITVTAP